RPLSFPRPPPDPCSRRSDQHFLRRRTCNRHPIPPSAADGGGSTRGLRAKPTCHAIGAVVERTPERRRNGIAAERARNVGVGVLVGGRRFFYTNQIPVRLHFLGGHHGKRCLRALAHL